MPQHSPRSFIILDNGAYEGTQLTAHDLLGLAYDYNVDEIVAPDVMGDGDATLDMLEDFMAIYKKRTAAPKSVMAVVQGQTIEECQACIRGIRKFSVPIRESSHMQFRTVTTLAFPKHLPKTTGWDDARIQLLRWVEKEFPGVWVYHYLGFVAPGELMIGAELGVRSLDTSAPFICSADNIPMAPTDRPTDIPPRQKNYLSLGAEYFHPVLMRRNIACLDRWADYKPQE